VTKTSGVGHRLLVKKWLMARNIEFRVKDKPSADGRTVYILDHCQFNDQHGGNGEVCIMQEPGGKLSAKCMHDGCASKGWKEFCDAIGRPAADHYDPPLGGNGDISPENKGKSTFCHRHRTNYRRLNRFRPRCCPFRCAFSSVKAPPLWAATKA
jgi:hypothetical protein